MKNTLKIALATPIIAASALGTAPNAFAGMGGGGTSATVSDESQTTYPPRSMDDSSTIKKNTSSEPIDLLHNDRVVTPGATWAKVELIDPATGNPATGNAVTTAQGIYVLNPTNNTVVVTPANDYTGTMDDVQYRATDSNGESTTSSIKVTVVAILSPVAENDDAETRVNTPIVIDILKNDKIGDAPITKVELNNQSEYTNGKLTLNPDNTVTFTPNHGECDNGQQDIGFTGGYTITDANGNTSTAYIGVGINCDWAKAVDDTFTTGYNTPITIHPTVNDHLSTDSKEWKDIIIASTRSGDVMSQDRKSLTTPEGVFTVQGTDVIFTPAKDYVGDVPEITYMVTDDSGLRATAKITGVVNGPGAPTATDDTNTTNYETQVNTVVLTNDKVGEPTAAWSKVELKDANGNYGSSLTTADGVYTVKSDNTIDFQPRDGFVGTAAAVDYRATDSNGQAADAKLTITVNGVTPKAVDDKGTTPFETAKTINPLGNDVAGATDAPLGPSTVTLSDLTAGQGAWDTNPTTGEVTFTPAKGFTGDATATYTVKDKLGNETTAKIVITVENGIVVPPSSPTAMDDTNTTKEKTLVNTVVLTNDKVTQDGATWSSVALLDTQGNLVKNLTNSDGTYVVKDDNSIDFTPASGFSGVATPVDYRSTDSNGKTADAKLTITVTKDEVVTPDPKPTAMDDKATTPADTPVKIDVLKNDAAGSKDIPLDPNTVTLKDEIPAQGTWSVDKATGEVTFTPAQGFDGDATATYTVKDKDGNEVTAKITISVSKAEVPSDPKPQDPKPDQTKPSDPVVTPEKPVTDNPATEKPVTPGPVIQTDMVGGGDSSTGLYGLSSMVALGGIAALRRRKR